MTHDDDPRINVTPSCGSCCECQVSVVTRTSDMSPPRATLVKEDGALPETADAGWTKASSTTEVAEY